jgi:hypothetical protein
MKRGGREGCKDRRREEQTRKTRRRRRRRRRTKEGGFIKCESPLMVLTIALGGCPRRLLAHSPRDQRQKGGVGPRPGVGFIERSFGFRDCSAYHWQRFLTVATRPRSWVLAGPVGTPCRKLLDAVRPQHSATNWHKSPRTPS